MKNNKILIRILTACIAVFGFIAVVLGIYLASRYIYNKSFKDTGKNDVSQNSEVSTEQMITTKETTEETTEITEEPTEDTTEDVTEATPLDAQDKEDITPPVLLVLNKEPYVKQWDSFDVHKYIGYADDWDRTPEFVVEGNVDTSTLGNYNLDITITDEAGNETDAQMTVHVVSELPSSTPRPSYDFSDFIRDYKNSNTEIGIDVSRWQGEIDFNQVKAAGCEFVIMRIGGYDDGSVYVDSNYYANMRNAKAAGLKVGIYYHAEERSVEEVKQNVKWLMGVLGDEKLDYPIAYDWEDFANFESYEINLHDINDIYQTFYDEINSYGYDAMLYSSKNYLLCLWTNEQNTPVWLAHYTNSTDYTGDYIMWQMGCTGRIPGISGDVDFNILYK